MIARISNPQDNQPFIDEWPMWDEALSKIPAMFDIAAARWRLARRFNSQPPQIPPAIRERQIDCGWLQHHRNRGAR